ncbi:hypothetical protein CQA53_01815 [Helicobacter didelphidarum]|uniref:DUF4410 domain-containing protein n=1 Tax=Helicobacter didelphidarum TaxID=2040648 RepID=A0A3D8IQ27_9HELI|nr:hypothetical protein [Helicobacter didelphidarum]RDU67025.1 hypothetical protein CQA53_01815 [Helicobacter didelphidarum]
MLSIKKSIMGVAILSYIFVGCADKSEVEQSNSMQCNTYKDYASATFEVEGDLAEQIEKIAKKALTKTCFKKAENSTTNIRVKIQSKQTLHTESGFIKDKHDNTLTLTITAIMLIPTNEGGLTTLTSKQNATLNLKSSPIADFGSKSELSEKEVVPFVEQNVGVALNNLFKEMP